MLSLPKIKYPVFGAAAMSTKMLEAQRARCISPGSCDTTLWTRESQLMAACAKDSKFTGKSRFDRLL